MMIIRSFLAMYMIALIVDAVMSFFPDLNKHQWRLYLRKACDYSCGPIRKKLPPNLPVDISPFIVILLIELFKLLW
jgi:YggT family protein